MANVRVESKPKREKARYAHGDIARTSSIKTVYVQDQDFWESAKDHAEKLGLSLSEMIMQSLAEYMGKDKNHCGTCNRVREILSAGSMKVKK
jgi:7-cyano-7-deazaguanine synthase in queuosine biosynthesis